MKKIDKKHLLGVLLVMILTAGISLEIGRVLPTIGALDTPANGTVSDYYIDHAARETASPNLVTAVLADYRGFDTLFETCVLFLSGVVVCLTLLEGKEGKNDVSAAAERKNLRQERKSAFDLAFRAVIPVLVIYAVYVLLHGEVSLGGGFQAGALLACAYLLDRISPGRSMYLPRLRTEATLLLGGLGTFFFALTGALCMIGGGSFLEYGALPLPTKGAELHGFGILMVEIGVTVCVMAVIIQILEIVLERTRFDERLEFFLADRGIYMLALILMAVGVYGMISCGNYMKKLICMNIMQVAIIFFFLTFGQKDQATLPVLLEDVFGSDSYINPLPHALMLTAIVVSLGTTGVGLALLMKIKEIYGTIEEEEITGKRGKR